MGFVVGIRFVAECGFGGVEGNRNTLWFEIFAVLQQCFEKAVGHAGRPPVLGGQPALSPLAEGIEAAEGQGMAIDQQQQRFGGSLGHGVGAVSVGFSRGYRPREAGR
ncbi:MAG: Uncharacterised protein [Synechococcus sp. CC9902]|nr:MAG: Uncharacterised protein [Synechococcus sp. CC9902]